MYCMDKSLEIILTVVAALIITVVVVWVTRQKMRGATRLIANTLSGGILIAGLSALNIIVLPFNLLNVLLVGVLGLPGAGVVAAAAILL